MSQVTAPTTSIERRPTEGRDRFLDVVKAVAVVRVVLWHTLSWPWLSWIPAMPAMFFANGALLDRSLGRTGWWPTVRGRLRRLLLPYWVYASASVLVMVLAGWRPDATDLVPWVAPVVDPVGSAWGAELWIPLWYVRAYLWFVLLAGPIRMATRRWPVATVAVSVAGVVLLGRWQSSGAEVPMAVGDLLAYSPFVVAGMLYHQRGVPPRRWCLAAAAAAGVAAVAFVRVPPGWDGVVNRSWTLTFCVGVVGLGLVTAYRDRIGSVRGRWGRLVDVIGVRALTIYLWQGFGLLVAAHLVRRAALPPGIADVLALVTVGVVVLAAVAVFGPLEDRAGGRPQRLVNLPGSVRIIGAVVIVSLVAGAIVSTAPGGAETGTAREADRDELPLSGRAVVERAGLVEESLAGTDAAPVPAPRSDAPVDQRLAAAAQLWLDDHAAPLATIGFSSLSAAVATDDGRVWSLEWGRDRPGGLTVTPAGAPGEGPVFPWWSLTKAATVTWLMRSVEAGLVRLDDPLARWVPESPYAAEMTLEQLARHTAGLPRDEGLAFLVSTPAGDVGSWYRDGQLLFPPGEGFNYSRTGYHLLALALERAEDRAWSDSMRDLGERAGAVLRFDDEGSTLGEPTDPDRRGYRGGLWASGGLRSTPADAARFFRWVARDGLRPESLAAVTSFSLDPQRWYYGLGLTPRCPCREEDGRLAAAAFGADGPGGSVASRFDGTATVVLAPDSWFDGGAPRREFFDLESRLLAAAG